MEVMKHTVLVATFPGVNCPIMFFCLIGWVPSGVSWIYICDLMAKEVSMVVGAGGPQGKLEHMEGFSL